MRFPQLTLVLMFQRCSSYSAPTWPPLSIFSRGVWVHACFFHQTTYIWAPFPSPCPSSQEQCWEAPGDAEPDPREYLSQTRTVQAMIHSEMLNTSSTVPSRWLMRVFMTKRCVEVDLVEGPDAAGRGTVKSLLCSSMTRAIRYRRRNMGMDRMMSTSGLCLRGRRRRPGRAVQKNLYSLRNGVGWRHTSISRLM